jgi:hypothetical protein
MWSEGASFGMLISDEWIPPDPRAPKLMVE